MSLGELRGSSWGPKIDWCALIRELHCPVMGVNVSSVCVSRYGSASWVCLLYGVYDCSTEVLRCSPRRGRPFIFSSSIIDHQIISNFINARKMNFDADCLNIIRTTLSFSSVRNILTTLHCHYCLRRFLWQYMGQILHAGFNPEPIILLSNPCHLQLISQYHVVCYSFLVGHRWQNTQWEPHLASLTVFFT